jgi:histidinol phosphatase-like enzyme (inositol monophosphatase family)
VTTIDRALLDEALDITRQAGALTLDWFRSSSLAVEQKADGTPVTAADRAAERFLRTEIARRWPDDAIIGEEEASTAGTSGRTWIIDPIDGTKAFARGVPLYCNLLAMTDADGPAIGVINLPALGEAVYAARGLGCFCDGRPATVSTRTQLDGAYVSSSSFAPWDDGSLLRVKQAGADLRTWGDGYGFALVATGRIDAMIDPGAALWDLAPMPVILTEAGGRFSTWSGSPDPGGGSALATNGHLHDELLALLAP